MSMKVNSIARSVMLLGAAIAALAVLASVATGAGARLPGVPQAKPLLLAADEPRFVDPSLQDNVKTGQVRYEYENPTNAMQQNIHDRLQAMQVLERLSEFLSPLRLPRPLMLKVQGCGGQVNAYYWRDQVLVCYEYFDFLLKVAPQMPTPEGLTRHEALAGMTADVFLHETGHAVFDMLQVPFIGREEDGADQFSAYVLLHRAQEDARRLILGVAYLGSKQAEQETTSMLQQADIHELPAQRYFNVLCMAYGEDPVLFADAVQYWHLPEKRAKDCRYEYLRYQYAFRILIDPYVDHELVEKLRPKRLLNFGSEAIASSDNPPRRAVSQP
jgi:Putative metallopeptidase